ncbi:MAG: Lrp/AsnC family transcriptional regulator [Desulfobacterales bacterium]|nr:Lrp/AsnC family transcriptional regulator [Desulfobacterales bacterium]
MKIDEINIKIIRELKQGRKSFKKIADKLRITENTVRTRVNKLIEAEILDICGLVDPASLPGHRAVMIGIKTSNMNIVEKCKELSKLKGVISASVVTGRYDIILMVLFKKNFGLLEFYTEELSSVKGINFVETFVIYKSYNLKVPYQF